MVNFPRFRAKPGDENLKLKIFVERI